MQSPRVIMIRAHRKRHESSMQRFGLFIRTKKCEESHWAFRAFAIKILLIVVQQTKAREKSEGEEKNLNAFVIVN